MLKIFISFINIFWYWSNENDLCFFFFLLLLNYFVHMKLIGMRYQCLHRLTLNRPYWRYLIELERSGSVGLSPLMRWFATNSIKKHIFSWKIQVQIVPLDNARVFMRKRKRERAINIGIYTICTYIGII